MELFTIIRSSRYFPTIIDHNQTSTMFVGESLCMIVYLILIRPSEQNTDAASPGKRAADSHGLKTHINPLLLAIPACFDIIGSTLMFIGLTQSAASVYQMMRGAIVIVTSLFSVLFLGRKQYRHHLTALFFIVVGIVIVGLQSVIGVSRITNFDQSDDSSSTTSKTTTLGIFFLIISQFFAGGLFISEEKILGDYYVKIERLIISFIH